MDGSPRLTDRDARSAGSVQSSSLESSASVSAASADRNHVTASECFVWRAQVSIRCPRCRLRPWRPVVSCPQRMGESDTDAP